MKSIHVILLWCGLVLIVCVYGMTVFSRYAKYASFQTGTPADLAASEFEEARSAYEQGGIQALSLCLKKLESAHPGNHYYLASNDHDLITGADLSQLRRIAGSNWQYLRLSSQATFVRKSTDDRYQLIFTRPWAMGKPPEYILFWVLLMCSLLTLYAILAFQFVGPLNQLSRVIHRFGDGDLSARVYSTRRDEIGDFARAFDDMASRIQRLLKAERQLFQDISHELRSPLARLSVAAKLTRSDAHREAAVLQIDREVARITALLESVIQMTRFEEDPSACAFELIPIDSVAREVMDDCVIEADERGCQLILMGPTDLIVPADHELIRRAIENLLRNAIRHAPPRSAIEVTLSRISSTVVISVRDYGCGVPPEALDHIFDPFFRVDVSRDMATGGIGLGLSIAKRALRLHHGRVWAENVEPGLRVCLELPVTIGA